MNKRIVDILKTDPPKEISVCGWVRSFRGNRFISLNDGSCLASLQVVIDSDKLPHELVSNLNNGASILATGRLISSQGSGQSVELQAEEIKIYGKSSQEELQKTILAF